MDRVSVGRLVGMSIHLLTSCALPGQRTMPLTGFPSYVFSLPCTIHPSSAISTMAPCKYRNVFCASELVVYQALFSLPF